MGLVGFGVSLCNYDYTPTPPLKKVDNIPLIQVVTTEVSGNRVRGIMMSLYNHANTL